jgi:hypothetical protein
VGHIITLPDGRPVKEVMVKQVEVELQKELGTMVAVRVVTCVRVFLGGDDKSENDILDELLGAASGSAP